MMNLFVRINYAKRVVQITLLYFFSLDFFLNIWISFIFHAYNMVYDIMFLAGKDTEKPKAKRSICEVLRYIGNLDRNQISRIIKRFWNFLFIFKFLVVFLQGKKQLTKLICCFQAEAVIVLCCLYFPMHLNLCMNQVWNDCPS